MKWIGIVPAIWYFLQYAYSPVFAFAAGDNRLTDRRYSTSVLPIVLLGIYGPWFVSLLSFKSIWFLSPLFISMSQYLVAVLGISPNTLTWDRLHNPVRDLRSIKISMGVLVALSASTWWMHHLVSPSTLGLPSLSGNGPALFYFTSLVWIVHSFFDLKHDGLLRCSWVRFLAFLALSTAMLGVGATTGLAWMYREDILAWRRSKGAIGYEDGGGLKIEVFDIK